MGKINYVNNGVYEAYKKAYVVEDGKYVKLKKAFVVENGKYVKLWNSFTPNIACFLDKSPNVAMVSDDGTEWQESATIPRWIKSAISVNGALYGIAEYYTGAGAGPYTWYLYVSYDRGMTWTQKSSGQGGGSYLLRYLDEKIFIVGTYDTSYKNIWYSSDLGATWTSRTMSVTSTAPTGSTVELKTKAKPIDFRYGTVGSFTGYFLYIHQGNSVPTAYIYKFSSLYFTNGAFVGGHSYNGFDCHKGALSIKDGVLRVIQGNVSSSLTYCRKITDLSSGGTNVKSFTSMILGAVASNEKYMVGTLGETCFKFDGETVTQGGSVGGQVLTPNVGSYYIGTFAAAFVGERVYAFKTNGSKCYMMYSDNYGSSWTIVEIKNSAQYCDAVCAVDENYY